MVRNVISRHEGNIVECVGRVSVRYPRSESGKIAVAPVDVIVDGQKVGVEDHINVFPGDYRNIPVPQVHWDVRRGDIIRVVGRVESYHKRGGVDYCIRDPVIEVVPKVQPRVRVPVQPDNRKVVRSNPKGNVVRRQRKPVDINDVPEGC